MNTLHYSDGTVWKPNWWVDSIDSNYYLDQEANMQISKRKSQNLNYRPTKNPVGGISNSENLEFMQHDCIAPDC